MNITIVDPYLFPARGRKLEVLPPFDPQFDHALIPTFSPQGDGNLLPTISYSSSTIALIPTFSPQGDGNV